jgi:LPXTG-motif cell wall-anchored protein
LAPIPAAGESNNTPIIITIAGVVIASLVVFALGRRRRPES